MDHGILSDGPLFYQPEATILLVDSSLRVQFASIAAQRLLAEGRYIRADAVSGELSSCNRANNARLNAIRDMVRRSGRHPPRSILVTLDGPDNDVKLVISTTFLASPYRRGAFHTGGSATLLLMMREIGMDAARNDLAFAQAHWMALFGLTPAEARLASLLVRADGPLSSIAQAQQLSHHTVRAQLASMFAKTSRRSQTALVRLLVRSLP